MPGVYVCKVREIKVLTYQNYCENQAVSSCEVLEG